MKKAVGSGNEEEGKGRGRTKVRKKYHKYNAGIKTVQCRAICINRLSNIEHIHLVDRQVQARAPRHANIESTSGMRPFSSRGEERAGNKVSTVLEKNYLHNIIEHHIYCRLS